LFNLLELFNIFYSKSYVKGGISQREIFDFIEARRLSRIILHQLNQEMHLVRIPPRGKTLSILNLQREYFCGQLRALTTYNKLMKNISSTNGISISSFMKQIRQLVKGDDVYSEAVEGRGGRPQDPFLLNFGWPSEFNKFVLKSTSPSKNGV
jgi:hypothetical protein